MKKALLKLIFLVVVLIATASCKNLYLISIHIYFFFSEDFLTKQLKPLFFFKNCFSAPKFNSIMSLTA
ncbi:hypothetical protein WN944_007361 [Citrus x changshan-huyou]|uniref:Lipoprotein n=1 Tax=Citrus x changshan-huyou TaxID=2935761 RepID=A0AAP0QU55_9ROSI